MRPRGTSHSVTDGIALCLLHFGAFVDSAVADADHLCTPKGDHRGSEAPARASALLQVVRTHQQAYPVSDVQAEQDLAASVLPLEDSEHATWVPAGFGQLRAFAMDGGSGSTLSDGVSRAASPVSVEPEIGLLSRSADLSPKVEYRDAGRGNSGPENQKLWVYPKRFPTANFAQQSDYSATSPQNVWVTDWFQKDEGLNTLEESNAGSGAPEDWMKSWRNLTKKQTRAAKQLGWTKDTWREHVPPASSHKYWANLTKKQQAAASKFGWTADAWDDFENHGVSKVKAAPTATDTKHKPEDKRKKRKHKKWKRKSKSEKKDGDGEEKEKTMPSHNATQEPMEKKVDAKKDTMKKVTKEANTSNAAPDQGHPDKVEDAIEKALKRFGTRQRKYMNKVQQQLQELTEKSKATSSFKKQLRKQAQIITSVVKKEFAKMKNSSGPKEQHITVDELKGAVRQVFENRSRAITVDDVKAAVRQVLDQYHHKTKEKKPAPVEQKAEQKQKVQAQPSQAVTPVIVQPLVVPYPSPAEMVPSETAGSQNQTQEQQSDTPTPLQEQPEPPLQEEPLQKQPPQPQQQAHIYYVQAVPPAIPANIYVPAVQPVQQSVALNDLIPQYSDEAWKADDWVHHVARQNPQPAAGFDNKLDDSQSALPIYSPGGI
jgi:hypothetical protein